MKLTQLSIRSLCALLTLLTVRASVQLTSRSRALTSQRRLHVRVQYAAMPNNFVFMAFYFVLPKRASGSEPNLRCAFAQASCPLYLTVFLNSLLATLNARRPLRETNSGGDMVSIPLSNTTNSRLSFSGRPQYSHSHAGHDDPVSFCLCPVAGRSVSL